VSGSRRLQRGLAPNAIRQRRLAATDGQRATPTALLGLSVRPARVANRQQGFTLLEVLVAFVVFVMIFGAVLDALGMALRNTRRSAEVSESALWAQSKLDAIGTIEELDEGSDSGEFNKQYRWQLEVRKQPVERTDGLSADTFPVELYRVELTVSWGDRNRRSEQHFVTLRSKLKEGQF
jgi:general secretion pathway protein I